LRPEQRAALVPAWAEQARAAGVPWAELLRADGFGLKMRGEAIPTAGVPAPAAILVPEDAYAVAQTPGQPNYGWLQEQRKLPTVKLEKAIRSFKKQIALHQTWINDPHPKFARDADPTDILYHQVHKWPRDMARHRQSIQILEGVIRERNNPA